MKNNALLLIFVIFYSCNAPRENPLDPYSDKGNLTAIDGQVQNFSPPFFGISGVSVFWAPENILAKTDNQGFFMIENLKPVNGLLIFSKDGYKPDSVLIVWDDLKKLSTNINLNKDPVLDGSMCFSVVSISEDSSFTSQILINVNIVDPDNDIDSAYIENDELNIEKKLEFNVLTKLYEANFSPLELRVNDLEQIIGLNFNIVVVNIFNKTFNIGSIYLKRVLKNGAYIVYPANSDTVSSTPTLSWTKFNAAFEFNYEVEIFNDRLTSMDPILSVKNIQGNQTNLKVNTPLDNGDYFWVLSTVDEFENRFQSATQIFHVK